MTSLENKRRGSDRSAASFEEGSRCGNLPEGWRAAVDKKTGRTYYVHVYVQNPCVHACILFALLCRDYCCCCCLCCYH